MLSQEPKPDIQFSLRGLHINSQQKNLIIIFRDDDLKISINRNSWINE